MHKTAQETFKLFLEKYLPRNKLRRKKILEVGSLNVNGNLKKLILSFNHYYIGVDLKKGPGVDIVLNDPYKFPIESNEFDAVICSSVFEHTDFFWLTLIEMARILKPNGLIYINAPSNGYFHQFPIDSYRFYPDAGNSFTNWLTYNRYKPILLESFLGFRDGCPSDSVWVDFCCIILKDKKYKNLYTKRIHHKNKKISHINTDDVTMRKKKGVFDYELISRLKNENSSLRAELNLAKRSFVKKIRDKIVSYIKPIKNKFRKLN